MIIDDQCSTFNSPDGSVNVMADHVYIESDKNNCIHTSEKKCMMYIIFI